MEVIVVVACYATKELCRHRKMSGNETEVTASCYFNLDRVLYESGAYKRPIENYDKNLVIREVIHGDFHPKIADTSYHTVMALDKNGVVNEALTCMMKAVELEDQCHGTAAEVNYRNKIASLYVHDKSDHEQVLFSLLKALDFVLEEKQTGGDTNLNVLCTHKDKTITLMHVMKKNYDEQQCIVNL